jgi:arylsulfatase A-like enzyme
MSGTAAVFGSDGGPRWRAAAQRLVAIGGVAVSATLAELGLRYLIPVPFAPWPQDVAMRLAAYALVASPTLLAGTRGWRGSLARAFLFAPAMLVFANLGFAIETDTRTALPGVLAISFGCAAVLYRFGPRLAYGTLTTIGLTGAGVGMVWTGQIPPIPAGTNVLMIVLDTTAVGHLSAYGYALPTTPNLDILARQSLVYERAVSAAPWTIPSHAAIFTGKFPSALGFREAWFAIDPAAAGSVAADLARSGYSAVAISANPWLTSVELLRSGFERAWDVMHLIESLPLKLLDHLREHWGYLGPGMRVTELAFDWLDRIASRQKPWFLFLNYLDPHTPYSPPETERRLFAPGVSPRDVDEDIRRYNTHVAPLTEEIQREMRGLYDGEIAAMDHAVGVLLTGLAARGYDHSNLLVIVTADHGESLGEQGVVGHLLTMSDSVLRVPLIVSGPGVHPGRVDVPVQTIQLRATIQKLLALQPTADISPALPPWGEAPALLVSERSEFTWYFKLLREVKPDVDIEFWRGDFVAIERGGRKIILNDHAEPRAYDLKRDPTEAAPEPVSADDPLIYAYRESNMANAMAASPALDPDKRERLRTLGYIR